MLQFKAIFLLFALSMLINAAIGQDASFSQFFSNQLYLNPGYTGNPKYQRAQLGYRNQWLTMQSPYNSYSLSLDKYFIEQNSGVGLNIVNDSQGLGAINTLSFDMVYSYTAQLSYNAQLKGGIQAGGIIKSQNTSNLIFPDMVDPSGDIVGSPGFVGETMFFPDFSAGVVAEWDFVYGGLAIHHLTQPVQSRQGETKYILPRKYTAHIGGEFNLYKRYLLRKSLILSPNIIYQQQSEFKQLNIGLYLYNNNLLAGLWLRENIGMASHTFMLVGGYHNEKYAFAYSYDFSILQGGFRGLGTSSHEVTFGKYFKYKTKTRKKVRTIKSPKF
jgi:type IX secretion system PorP/SprF family membrane protein